MSRFTICRGFVFYLLSGLVATSVGLATAGPVTIAMVPVGDAGNVGDTAVMEFDNTTGYARSIIRIRLASTMSPPANMPHFLTL